MIRERLKGSLILVVWLSALLSGPLAVWPQARTEKMRVAYPTISITMAPLWIAKDKRFFDEEGLDVELTYIRGGTTIVQAVIGGNVQVGYVGVPPVISAIARGARLAVVAVLTNKMDYLIVSRKPIKAPAELMGKSFAISSLGSSSEFAGRLGLERAGIDPNSMAMVQVGGSPDRIVALKSGSVDATILSATDFVEALGLGFHVIVDLSKSDIDYPFNTFFTMKGFTVEKRNSVLGLIRAFVRGIRFLREEKEKALEIVARHLRNPNMEILKAQWQHVAFEYFGEDLYPTEKGFALALKELGSRNPKAASLRMGDIVDVSFLDELSKAGFFKQVKMGR